MDLNRWVIADSRGKKLINANNTLQLSIYMYDNTIGRLLKRKTKHFPHLLLAMSKTVHPIKLTI